VFVNDVRTSCGCTIARLPAYPWRLAPGTNGQIQVTADLRGKRGLLHKMVYVYTANYGVQSLAVKVNIPDNLAGAMGDRARNLQIAAADRQAVFKNDCAKCHAEPVVGKKGAELYTAACAICHDAEHRASMVPDLRTLKHPTGPEHWRTWVAHGKVGTLMPAFAKSEGGPLTDEQVDSLVEYLVERIPSQTAASPPVPAPQ
jgi:mono/diheme cytochrome c family protein